MAPIEAAPPTRHLLWVSHLCANADTYVNDVTVGADGHVHLAMHTRGQLTATRADVDVAGHDVFRRVRLTPEGEITAIEGPHSTRDDVIMTAQRADASGGLVAVGYFKGNVALSEDTSMRAARGIDAFVIAYTDDGEVRWARSLGGSGDESLFSLEVLDDGTIIVVGVHAKGAVLSRKVRLSEVRGSAIFVAAYDADGDAQWAKSLIVARGGVGRPSTARLSNGDVIVVADYVGVATVGEGRRAPKLESRGASDVALLRIAADGSVVWFQSAGSEGVEIATDVSVSPDDEITVVATSSPLPPDNDSGDNGGEPNALIAHYDPSGSLHQVRRMNSQDTAMTNVSVASIPGGGVAFAGYFTQRVLLRGATEALQGATPNSAVVGRLHPDDNVAWAQVIDGDAAGQLLHVRWTPRGDAIVAGSFSGALVFAPGTHEERRVSCEEDSGVYVARYRMRGLRADGLTSQ